MKKFIAGIIFFALYGTAWAEVKFQCPSPGSIKQYTIPKSVNCAYGAVSDGVNFGGFNNCGLLDLPFVGGIISEVNGYWSLGCGYGNGLSSNVLAVGPDAVIAHCAFANGTRQCKGSLSDCTITCPQTPSIAGNAGTKTE